MRREKWIVGVRNTLANLSMECDSCAAIEDACMTSLERTELQKMLRKAIDWIDNKIR